MKSQAKEGSMKGRPGQAMEGAHSCEKSHEQGMEGARGGKNHEMDIKIAEGLEHGSVHPSHKKGIMAGGNRDAKETTTTSDGGSDLETLRQGNKPGSERAVVVATENPGCLKKARMFNERSENGGAEKEGGW